MIGETRLKATILWAMAAMLAAIGIVGALDQFGAPPVLAAFFPLVPILICLVVAIRMRSLAFADMVQGGAFSAEATGWALAGLSMSGVLLVAAPLATALGGWRGLILLLAFVTGFAVSLFLLMPRVRATGAPTLAAAIGVRFGSPARALASIAIVLVLLPLFAAEASMAGLIAARMLGIGAEMARDLLIALAAIIGLVGGNRAVIAVACVAAPVLAVAYLTPISIVSLDAGSLPMPWIGLFEAASFTAPTRLSPSVFLALAVCILAGVATVPTLLMPAWIRTGRIVSVRFRGLGLVVGAAVLLAAPSYGSLAVGLGIDPTTHPAGLVLSFAESAGLSAVPSVLLIGGLITATLVAASAMLAGASTALGNDLYVEFFERAAPEGRRIFIMRLGMLGLAIAAAALCRATGDDIALLAMSGLSIGAASLGPVLLLGWHVPRVASRGAVAGLAVGLGVTIADMLLALLFPEVSSRFFGMGSVVPTVLGPTGWFGLPVGLSGLVGIVFAILAIWAVTELPGMDWRGLAGQLRAAGKSVKHAAGEKVARSREARQAQPSSASASSASSVALVPATAATEAAPAVDAPPQSEPPSAAPSASAPEPATLPADNAT